MFFKRLKSFHGEIRSLYPATGSEASRLESYSFSHRESRYQNCPKATSKKGSRYDFRISLTLYVLDANFLPRTNLWHNSILFSHLPFLCSGWNSSSAGKYSVFYDIFHTLLNVFDILSLRAKYWKFVHFLRKLVLLQSLYSHIQNYLTICHISRPRTSGVIYHQISSMITYSFLVSICLSSNFPTSIWIYSSGFAHMFQLPTFTQQDNSACQLFFLLYLVYNNRRLWLPLLISL